MVDLPVYGRESRFNEHCPAVGPGRTWNPYPKKHTFCRLTRFTLLGAGTGIITTLAGANPLFGLAFLAVGYGIDKNKKKA